jgi:hypothetical protein
MIYEVQMYIDRIKYYNYYFIWNKYVVLIAL